MRITLIVALTLLIAIGLYVRIAPSDPSRWHVMSNDMETSDLAGGAIRVIDADEEVLARLHEIVVSTPRTYVLAGSVEEQMVTYVTRSRVFGFPDYTTIRLRETRIEIHGRLRFGSSDLGVNAARIDAWLMRLSEGG